MSQSYPALCMQQWCHCTVVKYRNFRQNEDKHHEVNIVDILCHLIQDLVVLIFFFSYLSSSGVHKRPWGCVVGWARLLFSLKNGPHLPRGSCLYGEALLYGEWCSAVVALGCWWCSVLWLVISTFTLCCVFQLWYVLMCFQLLFCASQSWFYLMERFIFGSCVCVMHSLVHNLNPYLPDVLTQFF